MSVVGRETPRARVCAVSRETGSSSDRPVRGADCDGFHTVSRETETGSPRKPGIAAHAALAALGFYRRRISPLLGARCRYYPTCSAYAEQAVSELGAVRGTIVALWRLVRCNPLSPGGMDPLESRRLFRSEGAEADAERREVKA